MKLSISLFISSLLFIQAATAAPYTGRLTCKKLPSITGSMPGQVSLQCEMAYKACTAQTNFNKLKPQHPLYPILKDRLEDYYNLSFEICELAIAIYNPDYYSENLKRR